MTENRRELATRQIPFFKRLSQNLIRLGLTPNQVSILSIVFAAGAGLALARSAEAPQGQKIPLFCLAIAGIQLRLLCNMLDGLMAVEGGLRSPVGEIYNDVPDRISDIFIFLGAGYAAQVLSPSLIQWGWAVSLFAVLTAYVRMLGASMTGKHDFSGPMAKQHRMFITTVACAASILETFSLWPRGYALSVALGVIGVGSLITCANRLHKLYVFKNEKS